MGIYLPNMEMPSLGYREIRIYPDGRVIEEVERGWEEFVGTAVPVPPHGDLIDLKAPFKAQYYDEMTEEWLEKTVTVEDALYGCMVDEMPPTIIPAEEGK